MSYRKRILWLIPVTVSIFNVQKHQPSNLNLHFDNYGGGFIDIAGYTGTSGGSGSSSIPWVYSAGYSYAVRDKFNLVPTPSALAINATQYSHFETTFVGQNPPTGILSTGFHNFSTAFKSPFSPKNNNERHLEFNSRNGNWLADELNDNPTFTNCSFFCNNGIISGPNSFCSSAFFSVPDGALFYNWEILQGSHLVTLSDNGTRQVTLTRSNNLSGYLTLRVTYGDNNPSRCGNATFEKEIWVGTLNFHNTELFDHSTMLHVSPIANNPMNECSNIGIKVNFWPLDQTVLEYQWEKVTQDVYWHRDFDSTDTSNRVLIYPTCNKNFVFKVRARNACGWSQWF
ncbi:MAG: hypothetical protein ACK4JX_04290 [Flavobacterium sp.]